MQTALLLIAAWLLDAAIDEPRRAHPLSLFGTLAERLEQGLNKSHRPPHNLLLLGILALILLTIPPALTAVWLIHIPNGWILELLILFFCLGAHSLSHHAAAVVSALRQTAHTTDLAAARLEVSALVSRDTSSLKHEGIAAATTESILENGNDALFATLFWFFVAGAPGALTHRLVNTLDAMWGYRNQRFAAFGWAAARTDDLLGWLPARLTALTYALLGGRPYSIMRRAAAQARQWPGVNPGIVLASGALALRIKLGGPTPYPEGVRDRPWLGETGLDNNPRASDNHSLSPDNTTILAAWRLLWQGAWLWLGIALAGSIAFNHLAY